MSRIGIETYVKRAILLSENNSLRKKLSEDIKAKVNNHARLFDSSSGEFYRIDN